MYQEIKMVNNNGAPSKAKIQDMRPIQPILQLKSQWTSACLYQLSPNVVKEIFLNNSKETRDGLKSSSTNNLSKKPVKLKPKAKTTLFPIDYFEKCVHIKDIEFSCKDFLKIYNSQQLKTQITNFTEANRMLLTGCRIMCDINSIEKSPSYFEIFGRRINAKLNRSRWFDVCLSRDEAFIADNKLVLTFGSISDLLEPLNETDSSLIEKSAWDEIRLVGLRTLSILLSKSKYQRSGTETCNFIIQNLLSHLIRFNLVDKCLSLLKYVLKTHWSIKTPNVEETGLIKVSTESIYYDELSPYFVKTDSLNKDSFVIPPPNLVLKSENSNPETNNSLNQLVSICHLSVNRINEYCSIS
ncbi:unnamed protein product [Brachionus calyciflorus]|uniref:Uncharacterized protein n=1 Tax=Brachionus calyciflorus TaxID=104777 RepID=A0A814NBQ9_9BILA|nr:unnamed protein product [Brachionus calyciflorus]